MTDAIPVRDLEEISSVSRGSLKRHFTATGFLVSGDSVLLHWHAKVLEWLPPGGHIEPNEDPVQAVLREIQEETGLKAEIYGAPYLKESMGFPYAIAEPRHVLIENINDPVDGVHQHIDMIYYCKLADRQQKMENWVWVSYDQLIKGTKLGSGDQQKSPPKDVREIGIHAIQTVQ